MSKPLSTEEIFNKLTSNQNIAEDELSFYSSTQADRDEIRNNILHNYPSLNHFADVAYISQAFLNEFLSGKKMIKRDKLLMILITLQYDLPSIAQKLRRFQCTGLYVRNERDFIIVEGICNHLSLDEIDIRLKEGGQQTLCPV